ncbi:ABC transporter permease [Streptomyces aurantiacus]|uniref:ABC transporter permease n=1 Tax=Streptomyces aurantiacus JA 4570 TaxID=1286094 RepID=S3ZAW9_9ACTN|nr:hypothetical protein [Streptomyces aurantiacus]EPH40263.1 hypothetical protein STRAU_6684 [Streptomyces aurantiacus JA 4570]
MSAPLLSGTRWAVLRLHRGALWGAAAFAALAALCTEVLRRSAEHAGAGTFLGFSDPGTFLGQYQEKTTLAALLLPALIGAFVGGPVLGRELEAGIDKFTLTQSVTPKRWLTARLALCAALAVGSALAALAVFRLSASDTIGTTTARNWMLRGTYESTGPVLVAYCLFAVGAGALAGLLLRRTLLAVVAAGGLTGALVLALGTLRWDLYPAATASGPATDAADVQIQGLPTGSFVVESGALNPAGDRFDEFNCRPEAAPGADCPADTQVAGWYADYHPRSHFWYVQLIETGIVLALAAAATYGAFWILRRRTP